MRIGLAVACALLLAACSDDSEQNPDAALADAATADQTVGADKGAGADKAVSADKAVGGDGPAGKVIYTDVNPDKTVTGWNMHTITFDATLPSHASMYRLWIHPIPDVQIMSHSGDSYVLVDSGGYPRALTKNDPIGASASAWKSAQATSSANYLDLNKKGGAGNFIGVTDKYIAVRFKGQTSWHYGWIRVDIDATPSTFVVKDHAYNSVADAPIKAGEGAP